ncbi:MAG TPA: DUF932 domain-containing protein [Gemmataceae bacterium]|nr:DUF932 domain-containing protein [Gemmataceae bacterium]
MQRANLFLHCGACAASREQVKTTQTPARTATWVPIPHGQLLTGVQACLERAGLSIVSESHGLTRDGLRYFGLLQVANGDNPDDFGLVVGVRNSHDKSFPAALALGASVFVCDNLSFSGEVKLARKHTTYIERDLPQLVDRAVGLLGGLRRTQEQRFLAYKSHELTEGRANDLLIQALDARVVPVTRLPDVLQEWREPRHPEFRQGPTAWRLFNAFTEILKGRLEELPRRTQALHGLMDTACGLAGSISCRIADTEIPGAIAG